jgi:hypothetical protein
MSETDLANLASLAAGSPAERRKQLEKSLPLGNLRFSAGLVEGLHLASTLAAIHSELAARCIRETAAVAAAQLLKNRKFHERASKRFDTAEVRAEIEEEVRRIEAGEVKLIPYEEVLRGVEEIEGNGMAL